MIILNDFNTSVEKALSEIDANWKELPGIIVCGTHKPVQEKIEDFITDIKMCRENNVPFLGICFGMQLMAIEYMRNVVGAVDATSEEFGQSNLPDMLAPFVVKKMSELRVGLRPATWGIASTKEAYGLDRKLSVESFWHNYKVSINEYSQLGDGFVIGEANEIVTYMKLKDIKNIHHVGVQFHPEYQSSIDKPHPILVEFINQCKKNGKEN